MQCLCIRFTSILNTFGCALIRGAGKFVIFFITIDLLQQQIFIWNELSVMMLKTLTILDLLSFSLSKAWYFKYHRNSGFIYFQRRFMNLCIYIYIILTGSRAYYHFESAIIWIRINYNTISVVWMHQYSR